MRARSMASIVILFVIIAGCTLCLSGDKVRIFVSESSSWQVGGGIGVSSGNGGGGVSGGARPQTVEIMKTFNQRCPDCTVTLSKENADYIVLLEHEGGKELVLRDNKVAVFKKSGDLIYSGSTRTLGNAVKDACAAITRDFAKGAEQARP